jgi:tetratricopeptide (TPR) repeat protein
MRRVGLLAVILAAIIAIGSMGGVLPAFSASRERPPVIRQAVSDLQLAKNLLARHRILEALPLARRALAVKELAGGSDTEAADEIMTLARILRSLQLLEEAGTLADRLTVALANQKVPAHLAPSFHLLLGQVALDRAVPLYTDAHENVEKRKELDLAITHVRSFFQKAQATKDPLLAAEARLDLVEVALLADDLSLTQKILTAERQRLKKIGPTSRPLQARLELLQSLAATWEDDPTESSIRHLERGRDIALAVLGPDHPYTADLLGTLGRDYAELGETKKAVEALRAELAFREKVPGDDNLWRLFAKTASTFFDIGETTDGIDYAVRAARLCATAAPRTNHNVGESLIDIHDLYMLDAPITAKAEVLAAVLLGPDRLVVDSDPLNTKTPVSACICLSGGRTPCRCEVDFPLDNRIASGPRLAA